MWACRFAGPGSPEGANKSCIPSLVGGRRACPHGRVALLPTVCPEWVPREGARSGCSRCVPAVCDRSVCPERVPQAHPLRFRPPGHTEASARPGWCDVPPTPALGKASRSSTPRVRASFARRAHAREHFARPHHRAALRPPPARLAAEKDESGWTPLALLARHLQRRAPPPPAPAPPRPEPDGAASKERRGALGAYGCARARLQTWPRSSVGYWAYRSGCILVSIQLVPACSVNLFDRRRVASTRKRFDTTPFACAIVNLPPGGDLESWVCVSGGPLDALTIGQIVS